MAKPTMMVIVKTKPMNNDLLIQFYYFPKITSITTVITPNCKQYFVQTMTNRTLQKKIFRNACILIGIGIALGAFGAHGLKKLVAENDIQTFKTGVQYQLIHAFGLLVLGLSLRRLNEKTMNSVTILFLTGMALFSGSLYGLVMAKALGMGDTLNWLGMITPLGGLCFIVGWFYLAFAGYKSHEVHSS
jgi:uncharacterized membrane protein YgdD (TMEM256/DUF423 family)